MDEWPRISDTTLAGTPAWRASVANVCRRSCSLMMRGGPAARTCASKSLEKRSGWIGVPSSRVKTSPVSSHAGLQARTLLGLLSPPGAKHSDRLARERDGAPPPVSLGLLEARLVGLAGNERLADREAGRIEVEVSPPEPEHFAPPHAGRSGEDPRSNEPVFLHLLQELGQLVGGPGLQPPALSVPLRRVCKITHVPGDASPPLRIAEGSPQDRVAVPNGPWGQSSPSVAPTTLPEVHVELVQMRRAEGLQGDRPQHREHVRAEVLPSSSPTWRYGWFHGLRGASPPRTRRASGG